MIQKHWNLRYIKNRIQNFYFEKKHKDYPWINKQAIIVFENLLLKDDIGVEFGSGSSTIWFSKKVKHLTSIEDHKEWFDKINKQLKEESIDNTTYLFKKSENSISQYSEYCSYVDTFKDESLDFIVIDGKHRVTIANKAVSKIKKGGFIYLDDSQRYIPKKTDSPHSVYNKLDKITPEWMFFIKEIKSWRKIWTTDGVNDATFFIKK